MLDYLPAQVGSYALFLELPTPQQAVVGRLGTFRLPAGLYIYLGSARGAGGIAARLNRHLRCAGRPHWHVEHLRHLTHPRGICYQESAESLECAWSQALAALPQARIPVPGFGASDCRSGCPAHLVWFPGGAQAMALVVRKIQQQAGPAVASWQPYPPLVGGVDAA